MNELRKLVSPVRGELSLVEGRSVADDADAHLVVHSPDLKALLAVRSHHGANLTTNTQSGCGDHHCSVSTPAVASKSTVNELPLVSVRDVP